MVFIIWSIWKTMCLLLFFVNPSANQDEYRLILVNVRDEVYSRPTKVADFWTQYPEVIGGMDIEPGKEGGTWLGMNRNGRIGALLNILQPDNEILQDKKGRGCLAVDYIAGETDCFTYLKNISSERDNYNGFLLVTLNLSFGKSPEMGFFTTTSSTPNILQPGIHAFGNSVTPETPWPKVTKAKENFSKIINTHLSVSRKEDLVKELFHMLEDRTSYKLDENMKRQGINKKPEFLDKLSAIFVRIPEANYGSRCHTVILIDGSNRVDYFERSRDEKLPADAEKEWLPRHFSFKLTS